MQINTKQSPVKMTNTFINKEQLSLLLKRKQSSPLRKLKSEIDNVKFSAKNNSFTGFRNIDK